MGKYRKKVGRVRSKRLFRHTASKVNGKNVASPMRGGIRL